MADAIVSVVLEQLISIIGKETNQQVRLVVGVRKEIEKLTSNFRAVQAVLLDAERRGLKEMAARDWLDKLKNASYDMDDVLDEWNTAILKLQSERAESAHVLHKKKVCFFFPSPSFCFKQVGLHRDIALKIKEINGNIDSIAREKHMFNIDTSRSIDEPQRLKTTHFVDVFEIRGREDEKSSLLSRLLSDGHVEKKGLHIISIVGMGGMGKTTLAQLVYNDGEVKSNFDKTIWVCVSDPFDEVRIAKAIIEGLTSSVSNFTELESLLNHIHESVSKTKFLLVLDDVWTEENKKWEPLYNSLNNGLHGSKILVTTRKSTVARMMKSIDIINIEELSKDESWLLFTQLAFFDRPQQECEKLEKIGREIVGKCRGLPLAVKTIGSLLRFKRTEQQWQRVLDSEMWNLEESERDIFPPLLLSYNDLPSMVKRCFSYCTIFSKDYVMEKDELIKLWMAQGYLGLKQNQELEIVGEEYFDRLALCSFFQDFVKDGDGNIIRCKMHDIVHDFAQFLVKNECSMMVTSSDEESSLSCFYKNARLSKLILDDEGASFPSNKGSIFKLRSLFVEWSFEDSSSISNCLPSLFKRLPCLRALELHEYWGLANDQITKIPSEIRKLIHLRYLNMRTLIKELPETLCELYNLQTLNPSYCFKLEKLPQGMGKLINLRHLINYKTDALSYMPKGIERLVFLRTLSKLVVGGDGHNSQVCSLDCLKKLDYLRGSLVIRGLGNVIDGAEAKNANLRSKKYLLDLKLYFDHKSEASSTEVSTKDEVVLEALHPTPNLEKLVLKGYRGMSFDWMAPLTQLRKLTLGDCINCEHLPPLGKLPLLQALQIRGMRGLKRVGNEFLGIKNNDSSSSSSSLIFFPKLKSLDFDELENLEDWEYEITEDFAIMPCLSYCDIAGCPKLKALPNHFLQATSLETLNINEDCPVLLELAEIYHHLPITRMPRNRKILADLQAYRAACLFAEAGRNLLGSLMQRFSRLI